MLQRARTSGEKKGKQNLSEKIEAVEKGVLFAAAFHAMPPSIRSLRRL
ncbi:hypothetical protein Q31b_39470 [Novipirellula aureliae]|uniref:Uncharacterized protein n=1 Tax=Novipirellula aureliae TaxID=2527966 RepID=A0A5C6DVN8_9BACT|nr:hypothetical protein [Novipirellula aureliae]TWU38869.1 hypothetical protein Q31b_39470 [Novipirellula aureliae]